MTDHRTPARLGLLAGVLVLVPVLAAAIAVGPPDRASAPAGTGNAAVGRWAMEVWEAARGGDVMAMEHHFDALPAKGISEESAARFRFSLTRLRENRRATDQRQIDQRAKALEAMHTEITADHLAKALRKAVEAQTYSEQFDSAFDDQDIMQLVRWAEEQVPVEEQAHHWLDAQEQLYLLRTFYEDTSRQSEFQRFDEHLKRVNERVGLIARYVPRRLHEMRNARAQRLGEEPFGEFNPATAIDWHERLVGVNHRMLKAALRVAANEHIETEGWRPLLAGGLSALHILATTEVLAETFPALADPALVRRWTDAIDRQLATLVATDEKDLDQWTLTDLLVNLKEENETSIKLPFEVVIREFGDGALDRLDTYSEIIWPNKLRRFQQATAGNFVGVGILIRHNDKREIVVVNPLEGTPAYFAGVKPDDLIMEVEGDSTVGWSLNDAVDRITGPKGTPVELGLSREGAEGLVHISIVRDVIKIRSVKGWWKRDLDPAGEPEWDWYVDPVSRIAYIRLTQFTEDSYSDLRAAWHQIRADGPAAGLILDLRHNPGGLLTAAVQISNLFVPEGNIVTGEDKYGKRAWGQAAHRNLAELAGVPTVVLVNRGSASASEIVSGCLQAHGAAIIVGERTFGKGSVQTIHHIDRQGRLKLTTQYYRLPSPDGGLTKGRLVHKRPGAKVWGVDPDVEVPMSVQQVADAIALRQAAEVIPLDENGKLNPDDPERPDVNKLLTDGTDPQLATALLILQARALASPDVQHALRPAG